MIIPPAPRAALIRFHDLCRADARDEIVKMLNEWPRLSQYHEPLLTAAHSGHASLLDLLLARGFNAFPEGDPKLIMTRAARSENIGVLEVLLRHGWDISY